MQILDHNGFSWLLASNFSNNISKCVHMYSSFKVSCSSGDVSSQSLKCITIYYSRLLCHKNLMFLTIYRMLIVEAVFTVLASIVASTLFGTLLVLWWLIKGISQQVLCAIIQFSSFPLFAMTFINWEVKGGVMKR